jgi:hypothetical protein
MRTTPEFLNREVGTFAALVADLTSEAIALKIPKLPSVAQMSTQEAEQARHEMRTKYCANYQAPRFQSSEQYDQHWNITISPRVAEQGGEHQVSETLIVHIPPSTTDGTVLRIKGKGAPKPDHTQGDLYLHVSVPRRPKQQRTIGSGDSGLNEWG